MIHKFSRYLLTLVALLTMTTGAWATEEYESFDLSSGNTNVNGTHFNITGTSGMNGYGLFLSGESVTVTSLNGENITRVEFIIRLGKSIAENITGNPGTNSCTNGNENGSITDINATSVTLSTENSGSTSVSIKQITVYYGNSAPAVEVTYSDDKTSAEFDMPSYDATLEYDIVRNMASNVDVQVQLNNVETTKLRIIKDGEGKYHPENGWSFIAYDMIDANNPVSLNGQVVYTLKKKNDQGEYTAVNFETDLCPGTWRLEVEGMETGNYGGIAYGEDITLYEGYEVTVPAGEYITYYKDEPVRVDHTEQPFAEIYTISSVGETTATLSDPYDAMKANTPMLVYNSSTETKTILLIPCGEPDVLLSVAPEFKGTLEATEIPASSETADYYVCTGNAFVWVKSAGTIGANKCWLEISNQPASARRKARSIVYGDGTTGIGASLVNSEERIVNSDVYDLNGQKVQNPTKKGIYIKNGKKVVIK